MSSEKDLSFEKAKESPDTSRLVINEEGEGGLEAVSCPMDVINCDPKELEQLRADLEVIFGSYIASPPMGTENKTQPITIKGIQIHPFLEDMGNEITGVITGELGNIRQTPEARRAQLELRQYWKENDIQMPI